MNEKAQQEGRTKAEEAEAETRWSRRGRKDKEDDRMGIIMRKLEERISSSVWMRR